VELSNSLRRAQVKLGEEAELDADALLRELRPQHCPSAFYKLLEREGPDAALEAWKTAEDNSQSSALQRQKRPKDATAVAKENARLVRRAFADMWPFLQNSDATREFIGQLEKAAAHAFTSGPQGQADGDERTGAALLWMLDWDGASFETKFGAPPAKELAVGGLPPAERKVAHQLARVLGLHSESRDLGGARGDDGNKVVALRPPRRQACCPSEPWEPKLSVAHCVAEVLAVK